MGLCLSHRPLACRTSETWESVSITFDIDRFKEPLSREFKFLCRLNENPPLRDPQIELKIFSEFAHCARKQSAQLEVLSHLKSTFLCGASLMKYVEV